MARNTFVTLKEGSTGDAVVNLQDCFKDCWCLLL